jgi:hypothetical protein
MFAKQDQQYLVQSVTVFCVAAVHFFLLYLLYTTIIVDVFITAIVSFYTGTAVSFRVVVRTWLSSVSSD